MEWCKPEGPKGKVPNSSSAPGGLGLALHSCYPTHQSRRLPPCPGVYDASRTFFSFPRAPGHNGGERVRWSRRHGKRRNGKTGTETGKDGPMYERRRGITWAALPVQCCCSTARARVCVCVCVCRVACISCGRREAGVPRSTPYGCHCDRSSLICCRDLPFGFGGALGMGIYCIHALT
jgi:hypothetical protein